MAALGCCGVAACVSARPLPAPGPQRPAAATVIAVLPPENLTGGPVPLSEIQNLVYQRLLLYDLTLVDEVGLFGLMARHRVRNTGYVDGLFAAAAALELGATDILVTSITGYADDAVPKLALTMRLVSATDPPRVLWVDGMPLTGVDHPGFLSLGVVNDPRIIRDQAIVHLEESLLLFLAGAKRRAEPCPGGFFFDPRSYSVAAAFDPTRRYRVAVLPFRNLTPRRDAGYVVALEFVRQLQASTLFEVVEPGVVRQWLLQYRTVLSEGLSLDTARSVFAAGTTDLILTGEVFDYEEWRGGPQAARVNFSTLLLDRGAPREASEVVFESTSFAFGDDGVWFFNIGLERTAAGLVCNLASAAVDRLAQNAPPLLAELSATAPETVPQSDVHPAKTEHLEPTEGRP
ncbi:MAG: hypothetical protein HY903_09880 [Deltaproteobacteria bacterium]|nr:hypothetical protein [Deltaproteobacteria bacterium]